MAEKETMIVSLFSAIIGGTGLRCKFEREDENGDKLCFPIRLLCRDTEWNKWLFSGPYTPFFTSFFLSFHK